MSTKLNWQAMAARERDAAVGQHLFGLMDVDVIHYFKHWTTCPKAAMEVIEAMRVKGFSTDLELGGCSTPLSAPPSVTCVMRKPGYPNPSYHRATGATMPEAVSRCALLAVGVEVG